MWACPGGRRPLGFELLWRLSAQFQVPIYYFAYHVGLAFLRVGGLAPRVTAHERALSRLGLCHAVAFGAITLFPALCQQHEYVLWGGFNILLPLLSQWLVIVAVCVRFRLLERAKTPPGCLVHPVALGALAFVPYWLGNSGIVFGCEVGIPLWVRAGLQSIRGMLGYSGPLPSSAFEEMATFHAFGMLGNDLLWRSYEWLALAELRAAALAPTHLSSLREGSREDLCLKGRASPGSRTDTSSSSEPSSEDGGSEDGSSGLSTGEGDATPSPVAARGELARSSRGGSAWLGAALLAARRHDKWD